ncbi:hypothetical protein [Streptomyces sp. MNU89]|uniref:hypothetical protein n=1 Tax=Streptomyces sp. MNU89 TaxID=2560025 RepID=UPI001E499E97|nr:hypothetical protein [Streptomyces sp. MNU89]MCC9738395.1 hypothetical protein [Streptomyces sp. MNU89]
MREAAAALRTAAVAWQQASAAWHRAVDLADPRHHPALPKAPYLLRHLGRVVQLPRVDPHPAVVTAWTSALRVGRLLYGPEWTAERRETAMRARPVEDVLADCGGPGALAAALYRLPATGWQLDLAAPLAVRRAQEGLVTDDIEGRPADLDGGLPFYPVSQQQVQDLIRVHEAVLRPEQTAASALIHAAGRCGTPVPRARLDAAAHNVLVREAGREAQPPRAVQRPRRQTLPPERPRIGRGGLRR